MPYDIVTELRIAASDAYEYSYDRVLYDEAANEIERLRTEIISIRAERDAAQTQADHLAKRLIKELPS